MIFIMFLLFGWFAALVRAEGGGHMPVRLSFRSALQSVDTVNFSVMMANARLQQAIARISQAQSAMLPHLDGLVSGARQTSDLRANGIQFPGPGPHIGPFNNFDARARVTIALFDPSAFERFQAAKKGENLSRAELEKTREDILALVASLFVDAERKEQTAKLLKTILDRDLMAYELSEESYTQGTGTLLETNKLKSDVSQTKYLYNQAKLQATEACLDLEAALQLPLDGQMIFIEDKDFIRMVENNTATNIKYASNADMVLASSQLEGARADQKTAYAGFLPKVSGSADYGRLGESPSHASNTYAVGLQVSVPIWEGGDQQAQIKESKAKVKEAQENLLDTTEHAQVNVAKAQAAITEADDLRQAKSLERKTNQRALRIALQALESGSGTALEVMKAKADLAIAEDEYNEAQATWVLAHIDLLHAQGRLRELVKKGQSS